MEADFDMLHAFQALLKGWWKIALTASVGGLIGLLAAMTLTPLYQAESTFQASIDFSQINFENLAGDDDNQPLRFTQNDEDLALQIVQVALIAVEDDAFAFAQSLDPALTLADFKGDRQISRAHALWHLRFRHHNPQIAQSIVNHWSEQAIDYLKRAQQSGEAEPFVIVHLIQPANLPQRPIYHNRNSLALGGMLFGLVAGILLVDASSRFKSDAARGV